jgi:transposase
LTAARPLPRHQLLVRLVLAGTGAGQVAESKARLVERFEVGPVLAAKLLEEVGDIGRFPTTHPLATHRPAPLEASSGQAVRHRLSHGQASKHNHAL